MHANQYTSNHRVNTIVIVGSALYVYMWPIIYSLIVFFKCSVLYTCISDVTRMHIRYHPLGPPQELTHCNLDRNVGEVLLLLRFGDDVIDERLLQDSVIVFLDGVSFSQTINNPSFLITGPATVTVNNCSFNNNAGVTSTLYVHSLNLFFTVFSNNVGNAGGAIRMSESTIWLDYNTNLTLVYCWWCNLCSGVYHP